MKKVKLCVNPKRYRLRGNVNTINSDGPIVYLMRRDVRAEDNWSLLKCQEESQVVRVVHILEKTHPSYRLAWFYAKGLEACQADLKKINIPLDVLEDEKHLSKYLQDISASALVADLNTLREFDLRSVIQMCDKVSIPCWEVDSHNIIPVWVASGKQEYAARTIRPKINNQLKEWLVEIPSTGSNAFPLDNVSDPFDSNEFLKGLFKKCTKPDIKFIPGTTAAKEALTKFIYEITKFEKYRNDPTVDALSGLSPWFRFGHLSKQRAAFEVKNKTNSNACYLEELIVRGELAENYTFYNKNYDNLKGAPDFAIKTLKEHMQDKRDYIYTYEEFADAKTHDELWNAAQCELLNVGKMHGFMRMYWAKKILEWTETPERALEIAIKLNDTFSMDGRDPRGYVGIMWSVAGLHDQGWKERPVFGKVRYMNFAGCKRKFDVDLYIKNHRRSPSSKSSDIKSFMLKK